MIRRLYLAVCSWLDLLTVEARTGVALVEAVAADVFEVELRKVTTPERRREVRQMAIVAAQLGIEDGAELERMARYWLTHPERCRNDH